MTTSFRRGVIVTVLHLAIVGSLGGKLLVDRATRPRVWARTAPYDPYLPIRGRYVRMRVEAEIDPGMAPGVWTNGNIALVERNGQLAAVPSERETNVHGTSLVRDGRNVVRLNDPVAYFIPEHVADPSRRPAGEELWVEVTIPRKGAPRPIRLGVKKDGQLTPLD